MPLNNFSSLLEFAVTIETQNLLIFDAAGKTFSFSDFWKYFKTITTGAGKRKKMIQRMRRENISEMVLEAMSGLDSDEFIIDESNYETLSIKQALAFSVTALERTARYYEKTADLLSRHPEVSGQLHSFAASLNEDLQKLGSFQ